MRVLTVFSVIGLAYASLQSDWLCGNESFSSLCGIVPKGPDGKPAYNNGTDPSAPWVIGRNDTLVVKSDSQVSPG